MKIAVFSDVHDNLMRWREAAEIIRAENIKIGICCGDVGDLQTVEEVAKSFEKLYLALGNLDFKIKNSLDSRRSLSAGEIPAFAGMTKEGRNDKEGVQNSIGLFPENVIFAQDYGEIEIEKVKIAYVHNNHEAKELAESGHYAVVFYGHTHTPWEEKIGNTILLNPGEVAGHFGRATFAIYDLAKMKAGLKILK